MLLFSLKKDTFNINSFIIIIKGKQAEANNYYNNLINNKLNTCLITTLLIKVFNKVKVIVKLYTEKVIYIYN